MRKNDVMDVNIQNKNKKSNRNGTGTPGPNCCKNFVTESLPKRKSNLMLLLGRLVGTA